MVQSINFPAWVITPRIILFERHLLQPHFKVKDIRNINFQELKRIGCKAVIFDKDNCLMRPYELEIFPNLRDAFNDCVSIFGPENVAIISNSAGSSDDHNYFEALKLEKTLGIRVVKHGTKKPAGRELLLRFFRFRSEEIVMIGDRILTDVVLGNMCNFLTIHTQKITSKDDYYFAKLIRFFENFFLKNEIKRDHALAKSSVIKISSKEFS